jgi:hypothetical protein
MKRFKYIRSTLTLDMEI